MLRCWAIAAKYSMRTIQKVAIDTKGTEASLVVAIGYDADAKQRVGLKESQK